MPSFQNQKTITEAALHQYAASLNAMPLPRYAVSSTLDPENTDREYLYIGMHHAFVALTGAYSNTTTTVEFLREPEGTSGVSKLNSIFTRGILPTSNKCRKLLTAPAYNLPSALLSGTSPPLEGCLI